MLAAIEGFDSTVVLLLTKADPNIMDNDSKFRKTALGWADFSPYSTERIKELLRNAMNTSGHRRLVFGELRISTLLVLGIAGSLLLLGYLVCQFKRRLTAKRQPVDTDLPTDLESGLTELSETLCAQEQDIIS